MDICEEFEDAEAAPPAAAPAAAPVAAPAAPTPTAPTASVESGAVVWAKMDGFPWWPAVVRRVDRAPPLIHVRFLQWEPPDAALAPTVKSKPDRPSVVPWADGEHHANWSGASKDRKKTVGAKPKVAKRLQAAVAEARRIASGELPALPPAAGTKRPASTSPPPPPPRPPPPRPPPLAASASAPAADTTPRTVVAPGDGGMAEVRHFLLHEASLEEYADAFEASGYDDLAFLKSIGAADFEVLSRDTAMKKGHAHKLAWKLGLRRDGGAYVRP
jgi:hypothetical protein